MTGATELQRVFRPRTVLASDGTRLAAFEAGDPARPAIALVNAYGMPVTFFEPIAAALAASYYLVTWEARGILDVAQLFDEAQCDVATHAADLGAVLDACNAGLANVVAWCSGALVALRFAAGAPQRIARAVLLSGSFPASAAPISEFAEQATALFRQCSESRRRSQSIWKVIFAGRGSGANPRNSLSTAWGNLPADLWSLVDGPYRSAEALYRYSNTVLRAREEPVGAWLASVAAPVLLLGGGRDRVVNPASWETMRMRLPHARLVTKEAGDHLLLYTDSSIPGLIREFLEEPLQAAGSVSI